jgi:phage head maturation protease
VTIAPSWQLGDDLLELPQARPTSQEIVICRTGTTGSLALVETADNEVAGTGRTLTGTAAIFDMWQEVFDPIEGHILEKISPRAFQKTLSESQGRVPLLLDHGKHPQLGSMMLGTLRSVTADAAGLRYVAELHRGVPELLREGLAAGQYGSSFRARAVKSQYNQRPRPSASNPEGIVEVVRTELALKDISPTSLPAYRDTSARLRTALPHGASSRVDPSAESETPYWLLCRAEAGEPSWKLNRRKDQHGRTSAPQN